MRVLITGIAGFAGRHLLDHLLATSDDQVWGIVRPGHRTDLADGERVRLFHLDLLDRPAVEQAVREARPDGVYHLAAQSSPAASFTDPMGTIANNVGAQVNLFEALLAAGLRPRVLVVGSNEEYGNVRPDQLPIREDTPFQPVSPYGVSKVAQDLLGYQYFVAHGLEVVRLRPFNHTGPGQEDRFVAPSFARQVAEIELGLREPVLRVGNLESQRDFSDVRDVVRGYRLALLWAAPGEAYNLGSERPVAVRALLDRMLALARVPIRVEVDPARFRPAEVPVHYCDCSKLRAATGWRPEIPLEQTIADILEDWRRRVAGAVATGSAP